MSERGLVTLNAVPTDQKPAREMIAGIENSTIRIHPDQEKEIMEKLSAVVSGTWIEERDDISSFPYFSAEHAAEDGKARECNKETKEVVGNILTSIETAEAQLNLGEYPSSYKLELAQSKVSVLKLLSKLETERGNFSFFYEEESSGA